MRTSPPSLPLLVAGLLVLSGVLLALTWRAWPDPLIDFGRELYAAWRLAEGDVLHRDLAWFNGPFSAWWNGRVLRLFGPGATALFVSNACWLAGTLTLQACLLRRVASRGATAFALAAFLVLLGFTQLGGVGNYNWIAPYSHELTHGVALASLALALALAALDRPAAGTCFAAGLATGMALLTKIEVSVALIVAMSVPVGALLREQGRLAACLLAGVIVPPLLAWARMTAELGAAEATEALLFPIRAALNEEVRALPFYRFGSGFDRPWANTMNGLHSALGALAVFALPVAAGLSQRRASLPVSYLVAGLAGGLAFWLGGLGEWVNAARFLPLVPVGLAALSSVRLLRDDAARRPRHRALLTLALFALALQAKVLLLSRIASYGFALSAPALLLLVVLTVHSWPTLLEGRGRAGQLARRSAYAVWIALFAVHLGQDARWREVQNYELGAGGDRWVVDGRGHYAAQALEDLEQRLAPGEPFLVLPEGVTLNYLARRPTPTRHLNFMPPEFLLFGPEAIQAEIEAARPRVVVLVHKDTSEYGAPTFGADYAAGIGDWLVEHYEVQRVFGAMPLSSARFGIAILERHP